MCDILIKTSQKTFLSSDMDKGGRRQMEGFMDSSVAAVPGPFRTQTGMVYEGVCRMIATGEVKPGESLSLRRAADRLGVSPGPARDAFRVLHERGVLEKIPKHGYRVCELTRERVDGYFNVRRALLAESAVLAAQRITPTDVRALRGLAERLDALVEMARYDQAYRLEEPFHTALARIARCEPLEREVARIQTFAIVIPSPHPRRWESHVRLLEEIASGDPERAWHAMRAHVDEGRQCTLEGLAMAKRRDDVETDQDGKG